MTQLRDWLRGLPKAELHVHLEGTVRPKTFLRIAKRSGNASLAEVKGFFRCTDFESFLKAFTRVARTLELPEDFADVAYEYLSASAHEGVKHVEFFFSPATIRYFHPRSDLVAIVAAIHEAAERARQESGISSLLILDMVRNLGQDTALEDIDLAERCVSYGVIGVGLGGDERKFPARDFEKAFTRAGKLGFRKTAHAGEAAGPQSVRDAIELLGAERVGHGVAAARDDRLLQLIVQRGIAIDSCLTSNKITGASPSHDAHPLKDFLARGASATLSSDDPAFFGATLLQEFELAAELGFRVEDLVTLARNSFEKSFAPEDARRRWIMELDRYASTPVYCGAPGTIR